MGKNTGIDWTDATVNFWVGCQKVSPGCKYCYMFRDMSVHKMDPKDIHRTRPGTFEEALKWKEPMRVFTNSWSDFFLKEADEWRDDAWAIIRKTPHITWQILTKRVNRIKKCLPPDWGSGWDNVWIGMSAENQELYDERIPLMDDFPAKVKFISMEPLLGPVHMGLNDNTFIQWVILGGESGNDNGKWLYRPSSMQWYESLIMQCDQAGIPVFMKQLGTHLAKELELQSRTGKSPIEWPAHLQRRDFPVSL